MAYKNTQIGYFTIFIFGAVLIFLSVIIQAEGVSPVERPILHGVLILFLVLTVIFSSLTVEVNRQNLVWYFGPGIWKYRIPLDRIKDVSHVRSHPLEGIGIRWNPLKGWLYNVSGLNAVKVIQKGGKTTRIGTSEPQKLIAAIKEEMKYRKL